MVEKAKGVKLCASRNRVRLRAISLYSAQGMLIINKPYRLTLGVAGGPARDEISIRLKVQTVLSSDALIHSFARTRFPSKFSILI